MIIHPVLVLKYGCFTFWLVLVLLWLSNHYFSTFQWAEFQEIVLTKGTNKLNLYVLICLLLSPAEGGVAKYVKGKWHFFKSWSHLPASSRINSTIEETQVLSYSWAQKSAQSRKNWSELSGVYWMQGFYTLAPYQVINNLVPFLAPTATF